MYMCITMFLSMLATCLASVNSPPYMYVLAGVGRRGWEGVSVKDFLHDLELDQLFSTFELELISMDVLMDMSHDDLNSVGITAFGHRHKILRKMKELVRNGGAEPAVPVGVSTAQHIGTQLIQLPVSDKDFIAVSEEVGGDGGCVWRW